jgi:hypothetical protein
MISTAIIDSGPLFAVANRADPDHARCLEILEDVVHLEGSEAEIETVLPTHGRPAHRHGGGNSTTRACHGVVAVVDEAGLARA